MGLLKNAYEKYNTISVVGMAKNAGKTVTFNHLIEEAAEKGITIGITSTGRDGERIDIVTATDKPTIYILENTIVATAKETFLTSEVQLEILEVTSFHTALGEIVIGKAKNSGLIEIAGPSTNQQMKEIIEKLRHYGAQLVLVDGAINRKAAASPSITDATIIATGAVLNRNINRVVEETLHQVELFNIKKLVDIEALQISEKIIKEGSYALIDREGRVEFIHIPTSLNTGRIIGSSIKEKTRYMVISGGLVKKTIEDIIEITPYYKNCIFVIKDATRVFINQKDWSYFKKRGIRVNVVEEVKVLAVTINPIAPQGYEFDSKDFALKMREALKPIPVVDVMMEELNDE